MTQDALSKLAHDLSEAFVANNWSLNGTSVLLREEALPSARQQRGSGESRKVNTDVQNPGASSFLITLKCLLHFQRPATSL